MASLSLDYSVRDLWIIKLSWSLPMLISQAPGIANREHRLNVSF